MARDSERYRGARGLCPPLPSLPPSWSTVHPISLGEYERHRRTPVTGLARSLASATSPERIDATRTHSLCRSMRGGAGKGGGLGEGRRSTANKTRLRRQLAAFRPPGQTTSPHDANARERAHAQRRPAPQRGTLALPSPCTPPAAAAAGSSNGILQSRDTPIRRDPPRARSARSLRLPITELRIERRERSRLLYSRTGIRAHERAASFRSIASCGVSCSAPLRIALSRYTSNAFLMRRGKSAGGQGQRKEKREKETAYACLHARGWGRGKTFASRLIRHSQAVNGMITARSR